MIMNKKTILSFAIFGAFLIVTTALVQPINAQAVQLDDENNNFPTATQDYGENIRSLFNSDLIKDIQEILSLANSGQDYIYLLKPLSNEVIQRDDFKLFSQEIKDSLSNIYGIINKQNLPRFEESVDSYNDYEPSYKYLYFEIFKSERSRERSSIFANLVDKIFGNHPLIENILTRVAGKFGLKKAADEGTAEPLSAPELKFNLYNVNTNNAWKVEILKKQSLLTIHCFLFWINAISEIATEEDEAKQSELINNYCDYICGFQISCNDNEIHSKISEIAKDDELKALVFEMNSNYNDKVIVQQKYNEIKELLSENTNYQDLVNLIEEKYKDYDFNITRIIQLFIDILVIIFTGLALFTIGIVFLWCLVIIWGCIVGVFFAILEFIVITIAFWAMVLFS